MGTIHTDRIVLLGTGTPNSSLNSYKFHAPERTIVISGETAPAERLVETYSWYHYLRIQNGIDIFHDTLHPRLQSPTKVISCCFLS